MRELAALQDRVNDLDLQLRRLRDEAATARQAASADLQRVIASS